MEVDTHGVSRISTPTGQGAPETSEGSLRELFDGIPVGVYRTTASGKILDANLVFAQMLGYSHPDALLVVNAADLYVSQEDRTRWKALMDLAGVVHDFELELRRPDGGTIWVRDSARAIRDAEGRIRFYQGTLEDITDRRQAEGARRESEARFHLLFEDAPIGMVLVSLDHRLLKVNRAFCELLGYAAEELSDKKFTDITHPDDVEQDVQSMKARQSGGSPEYKTKKRYLKKNGEVVWVNLTAKMIRDERGKTLYGLGMVEDITERQRTERALHEANENLTRWVGELEQRNREMILLSEMGDLLQSCRDTEEACAVIGQRMPQIFATESGAVCVLSASRKLVEAVATWGDSPLGEQVFAPADCWALRRGRPHVVHAQHLLPVCGHFHAPQRGDYICVPMMAQGEAIGLVTLKLTSAPTLVSAEERMRYIESKQRLAGAVAEQIAMALANLNLRDTLRRQSIRDPLTGLFNRRYMEETLERELHRANRKAAPIGIIMLDLDHFKMFNDTFGHLAGDALLRALGEFLQARVRGEDIVCRHGGEEFAIIMPEASLESTRQRAEHLREDVKTVQVQYRSESLGTITLSAGIAAYPDHGSTAEVILRAADAALYRAKAEGRNRVIVAPSTNPEA